jgi:hypothetical protein
MRCDLPQEIPRDLPRPQETPLEPSPVERRREQLQELAQSRATSPIPWVEYLRTHRPKRVVEPDHEVKRDKKVKRDKGVKSGEAVERRPRRDQQPSTTFELSLRPEEQKMLNEIGRFRVLATRDIADTIYSDHRYSQLKSDLRALEDKHIVSLDFVNARRDGRGGKVQRIEVVTLTKKGRRLVRETSDLPKDQQLYHGLVKPREVEHDTQIYRAYLKQAKQIEKNGGTNLRVRIDFELKADIQQAIYKERKLNPTRDLNEVKQEIAPEFGLAFVDNKIQIPDARIEYDLPQGGGSAHEDIEVVTAAYRPGHLRGKMQAGFHLYASTSDRATLTAKLEHDHHLMERILEL